MNHQKIINLLDSTTNQFSKFGPESWVEIFDDLNEVYATDKKTEFKISMLKWILCNYSDAYILVKETISVANTANNTNDANNTNIEVIFKNCAPFQKFLTEINNTQLDDTQGIEF